MKITSYKQLDKLVAQSLGWATSIELIDQGEFVSDLEVEYYHPPDLDEDELEDWFGQYGVAPDFSENWFEIEDFLLPECDRQNIFIEWQRSQHNILCTIRMVELDNHLSLEKFKTAITGTGSIPRSMPLATCLAWLAFKGVEFELELPNEETNPETIAS